MCVDDSTVQLLRETDYGVQGAKTPAHMPVWWWWWGSSVGKEILEYWKYISTAKLTAQEPCWCL